MRTAPVRVDRVAERHARRAGHFVDYPPGVHMEELHAPELAGADVALDQIVGVEQRSLRRRSFLVSQLPSQLGYGRECSEHLFDSHSRPPRPTLAPSPAAKP